MNCLSNVACCEDGSGVLSGEEVVDVSVDQFNQLIFKWVLVTACPLDTLGLKLLGISFLMRVHINTGASRVLLWFPQVSCEHLLPSLALLGILRCKRAVFFCCMFMQLCMLHSVF
jgi:hypothetical protein